MTLSDYLSDKRAVLLTCLAGGLFFSVLLYLYGIAPQEMFLLWICSGIYSEWVMSAMQMEHCVGMTASTG